MNAAQIATALGGARREGRGWRCHCPLHGGHSLVLADGNGGTLLVTCWGGCDRLDVLAELRRTGLLERRNSDFGDRRWASGQAIFRPDSRRLECSTLIADQDKKNHRANRQDTARYVWGLRRSIVGSPVETYLRRVRCYSGPIPATLGLMPASEKYPHTKMIAAFGRTSEPEPGMIALASEDVCGVHLTLLREDGQKAGTERDKVMIGGELGVPIVLAPPNDLLGLIITEGIEDGLSLNECTGLGVWVAGAAGRMPALAETIPSHIETVSIAAHDDQAGMKGAHALADGLHQRGIETKILSLNATMRAAA